MSQSAIQAKKQQKKKLSAAQRKFNATIRKIEKERQQLTQWQETATAISQKQNETFVPLMARYNQSRVEMVKRFDSFFERKSFSGVQKDKMEHFICETSGELIAEGFDELREIHDSYSSESFGALEEYAKDMAGDVLRDLFESEFGVDIGDDLDVSDPEAIVSRFAEKLEAMKQNENESEAEEPEAKKKTASETKREAKQREEEKNISQSIKSVYRQLTTALHPDRETDEAERVRKTELMQKVTQAYREKDLLKLLELQLKVEQIDQTMIDGIADDRLRHFNKVLDRQLEEISLEVTQVASPLQQMVEMNSFGEASPEQVMQQFDADIANLEQDTLALEKELPSLKTVKSIQQWLRGYRLPNPFDVFNGGFDIPPGFFRY